MFIRGNGTAAAASRELSAHSSAMKLQQIRAVRQAERWMSRHVRLGRDQALAGQSECPLADGPEGRLDDTMEAGWKLAGSELRLYG